MTSVRLTKLTSLFAALALVFALFCAASTVCAADTEAGTTAAAEAGETEATETEPEATEPAGSGTLTTGTDTEKKDLNWDLIITLGCLVCKLVARKIKDLKALVVVLLKQLLQALVLRCEAAAGGGIDDQNDLVFE